MPANEDVYRVNLTLSEGESVSIVKRAGKAVFGSVQQVQKVLQRRVL